MSENNDKRYKHICYSHNGHYLFGKAHNTLAAAHYAEPYGYGEHRADDNRRPLRVVKAVRLKCALKIVRAEQIKPKRVCSYKKNAKNRGYDRKLKRFFNVISGASEIVSILVLCLNI